MKLKSISRDQLGDVVGGIIRTQAQQQAQTQLLQSLQSSQSPMNDRGPQNGASTWQPPGASYHYSYGPWKNGSATSWQTISNKDGSVISSGNN